MELNVQQPWLGHILKGRKTVEGRLAKGRFAELQRGNILIIGNRRFRVSSIVRYGGFKEYLTQEGLARTLPGVASVAKGVAIYRKFYAEQAERQHGVLAIRIKPISN